MSQDIASRLAALRQHFENFTISGRGMQVQGSIKDGFVIAAGVGDGGAGTGSSPTVELLPPESVTLVGDSISASRAKCGYEALNGGDGFFYSEASYAGGGPNVGLEVPTGIGAPISEWAIFLKRTIVATGTTHPEDELNSGCNPAGYTHSGTFTTVEEADPIACTSTRTECEGSVSSTDGVHTYTVDCDGETGVEWGICMGWEGSIILEDEYTTAALIANTIADLPAFDSDFDDSQFASRSQDEEELTYAIQRLRYKFTFTSTGASFSIHWKERFTPDVGSPVDTPRSTVIGPSDTESAVFTLNEPAENGITTIEDIEILG